jgi:hypothetical protein
MVFEIVCQRILDDFVEPVILTFALERALPSVRAAEVGASNDFCANAVRQSDCSSSFHDRRPLKPCLLGD